jgi:glutamyl-tRNA synthetase
MSENPASTTSKLSRGTINRILQPERTVDEIEATYPSRKLGGSAEVTRIAPSPTGFIHIGAMYAALISQRYARQSGGVFYLRMEDTDRKREVEGARGLIMRSLTTFGIDYDEGPVLPDGERGDYGPYIQSRRQHIYDAYTRQLLENGRAYPCFATPEEIEAIVAQQSAQKLRPGYYGSWAIWRDRPEADVVAALDAGKPFVIRYRSEGNVGIKRSVTDLVKGTKDLPENDNDIVIRKQDGLPTYHLAHVVDDHLMHTTTVIRADEWFTSCMLHIQLAESLGIAPFKYAHIAPIQKMDGSSRRKLSKRHDPEASVDFYLQNGYPVEAVIDYMLNQGNAAFEEWRRANPSAPKTDFVFDLSKLPKNSGALLNMDKLDDISKDLLGTYTPERLYEAAVTWADTYDPDLAASLRQDPAYTVRVFGIERDNNKRKDISKLSELRETYGYFFDDLFAATRTDDLEATDIAKLQPADRSAIASAFLDQYDATKTQDEWFEGLKAIGESLGFTPDMKAYRKDPEAFKGSVADVAMALRVALTGRNRSPNLHELMLVMGEDRIRSRISRLVS